MVEVCINYSDLLSISLPISKQHFDKIVVVTCPDDKKTIEICKKNDVECVITDRMYENPKDILNKGKAINEGIKRLEKKDWLLITDADIAFPHNTRNVIERDVTDKNILYCAARRICKNRNEWMKYVENPARLNTWIAQAGWRTAGLGFFQLVNFKKDLMQEKTMKELWYSENFGHCGRSDRAFLHEWGIENKIKFDWKELSMIHMGESKVNWLGRKTEKF